MLPQVEETKETGFQFCNLTEINGGEITDIDKFIRACRAASILGTLQAGYTDFGYLSPASKIITEREALIGVSITGWMNNPDVLFVPDVMDYGANVVKEINAQVAKLIGINQAARTTCVKPSGNASVILGTGSGIHGEHAYKFFRNVQMNEQEEVLQLIKQKNPGMVERSVWSATGTDYVVSFPIEVSENSITKSDLLGVKQLEYVKLAQQYWVEAGTNVHLCTDPKLRHNVSNTISVDDWDEVRDYIYENRKWFAGISLLSSSGDKSYAQAPFTEVITKEQLIEKYGVGSVFASGMIVDGLSAFNNNLWLACSTLIGEGLQLTDDKSDLLKRDWIRRANNFNKNYFNNNINDMIDCLKDCYNLHKWESINRSFIEMNFEAELQEKRYVEVDSLAGAACAGGACEIVF